MEDFVTFEIAETLKEKGFSCKHTFAIYFRNKMYYDYGDLIDDKDAIIAPTISQVMKWLREEKKIYVGITYMPKIPNETGVLNDFYYPTFQKIGLFEPMFFIGNGKNYDTYEQAAIAGIEFAFNKLI